HRGSTSWWGCCTRCWSSECLCAGARRRRPGRVSPRRSLRLVTDSLDVVTVRIEHKRPVVVWMVIRPQARRTVVPAACCDGCLMEGIQRSARGHTKCDVDGRLGRIALIDPEVRSVGMTEAGALRVATWSGGQLHQL